MAVYDPFDYHRVFLDELLSALEAGSYIRPPEAARMAGLTVQRLYQLLNAREGAPFKAYRIGSNEPRTGDWYIERASFEAWLAERLAQ